MADTNPVSGEYCGRKERRYVYAIFSMFSTELRLQQRNVLQQGRHYRGRRAGGKMSGDLL